MCGFDKNGAIVGLDYKLQTILLICNNMWNFLQ